MTKSEIRSYLKRRRNDMPISLRRDCSKKIQDRLYSLNEFRECKELFTYISFGSEVDTYDIIKKSLEMNKKSLFLRLREMICASMRLRN